MLFRSTAAELTALWHEHKEVAKGGTGLWTDEMTELTKARQAELAS